MTDYLVTAKAEVLYEKASDILAKYEAYFRDCSSPLECIEGIYKNLCDYSKKIILCSDEETYQQMERNIDEYEKIISNIFSSASVLPYASKMCEQSSDVI